MKRPQSRKKSAWQGHSETPPSPINIRDITPAKIVALLPHFTLGSWLFIFTFVSAIFGAGVSLGQFSPNLLNSSTNSKGGIKQESADPSSLLNDSMAEYISSDYVGIDLGTKYTCDKDYMNLYSQAENHLNMIATLAHESEREGVLRNFVMPRRPPTITSISNGCTAINSLTTKPSPWSQQ